MLAEFQHLVRKGYRFGCSLLKAVRFLLQRHSALSSSIKSRKALVSIIFPSLTEKSLVDIKMAG
jgi:hypothetical protein